MYDQLPTYHHISPLTRSRSSSVSYLSSAPHLRRSHSYTGSQSNKGFTLPSYGYGGGFMARSLSRIGSTLFGRSLSSTALNKTPPMNNVGVQRSTPHFSDKYPHVRYSYGNINTGLVVLTQTELKNPNIYGICDTGTKRWLEGKLNAYNTGLFTRPFYKQQIERPIAPTRNYVKYMPVDDAMSMYKNRYMTVGTLSKYWLNSSTLIHRRDLELKTIRLFVGKRYSLMSNYSSKTQTPFYSKVTNRL